MARGRSFTSGREYKLLTQYGLTLEDYVRLDEKQGGRCASCREFETAKGNTGRVRLLAVDHDHETGEVRGLLCSLCNTGVGSLGDDPVLLRKAVDYLEGK